MSRSRKKRRRWHGWNLDFRLGRRRGQGRSVNGRFMLLLLVSLSLLTIGVVSVHAFQVRRNADIFKRQAEQAAGNKRYAEAAAYYSRYLRYRDDPEAREAWADVLEKKTVKSFRDYEKALELYEAILRRDPDAHPDIRRKLVDVCIVLHRFTDAQEHIRILLDKASPKDGKLEQLSAMCYAETRNFPKAKQYYQRALNDAPNEIASYVQFAKILDAEGERKKADQVMKDLVDKNDGNYEAHLSRARYLRARKNFADSNEIRAETAQEIKRAYQLAGDKPETLLALIELAQLEHQPEQARKLLTEGVDRFPTDVSMYLALSRLEILSRRLDDAIACVRRGLKAVPADRRNVLLHRLALCLMEHGDLDEAAKTIEELEARHAPGTVTQELRARVLFAHGNWADAVAILEKLLPHVEGDSETAAQINLLLGVCYEKRGEIDLAFAAYQQALRADPHLTAAREGYAGILELLGRREDALAESQLAMIDDKSMGTRVARLLIQRNLRLPESKRDWAAVESALEAAEKASPNTAEVVLVRVQSQVAQGDIKRALAILKESCAKQPDKLEFWLGRANLVDITGQGGDALDILKEAETKLGERIELRLARAYHWQRKAKAGAEAVAALHKLEENTEKFSSDEESKLLRGLGEAYFRAGNLADAKRLLQKAAAKRPGDMQILLALFDVAVREKDRAALDQITSAIKELDGDDGSLWRYTKASSILNAGDRANAEDARRYLVEAAARRPSWGPVYRGLAAVDELEGNAQRALEHYEQALANGDRHPYTLRRAVDLLYNQQRYAEADRLLTKMDDQGGLPLDYRRTLAVVRFKEGDLENAVTLAKAAIDQGSQDPRDFVWLGQVLLAAGGTHIKEAEEQFRNALTLPDADKLGEPWVALVQFLVRTNRKSEAQPIIDQARTKLPADVKTLALAKCYEALGELDKAAAEFNAALKLDASDVRVLREVASFYLVHAQLAKAEPYLLKLLDPATHAGESDLVWARRGLALKKATGDYRQYKEALAMLEENTRVGGGTLEDQRTLAVLLARHPRTRTQALRILERLQSRQPPTLEQLHMQAQLYEAVHDWQSARATYSALASNSLSADEPRPVYAAEAAKVFLKHHDVAEAALWMQKLVAADPNTLQTVDLQVRVLKAQDKTNDALALLKKYADSKGANFAAAARLFEEIEQFPLAEQTYRKWVAENADPKRGLALAGFLGRRDRKDEALDLCERAASAGEVDLAAAVAVEMLRARKNLRDQHFQAVERLLDRASKKSPESPLPVLELAELRDLQQRYAEAEACYRRVLEKNGDNIIALNNLAWLLAVHDNNLNEAMQLVDRSIMLAGELGPLLDTRAIIFLKLGKLPEAQLDLEKAIQDEETAARFFHLAQAQQQKNRTAAIESLRRARDLHLSRSQIHPLEFKGYDELLEAMDEK
ncbi:MAG TPA: tetratricopeptide repeat protein [Gemmataceae bacterium]|nr:tetratricopeptide repeat protein [Gemmataceae bacterium]